MSDYDLTSLDHAAEPTLGAQLPGPHVLRTHPETRCAGEWCVVHNPSDHHMRSWPLNWRGDRGLIERICPAHGVGHPDPDHLAFTEQIRGARAAEVESVHGCCGCCAPPKSRPNEGAGAPDTEPGASTTPASGSGSHTSPGDSLRSGGVDGRRTAEGEAAAAGRTRLLHDPN